MLVKEFMTPVVITVSEDQSMLEARELMRSNGFVSIPVVDDIRRVRGIITIDDIGRASPSDALPFSSQRFRFCPQIRQVKQCPFTPKRDVPCLTAKTRSIP